MSGSSTARRGAMVAAGLAVLLTLTGCSTSRPTGNQPTADQSEGETKSMSLDETVKLLRSRPDIEQIMVAYNRLLQTMVNDLNEAGLTKAWTTILAADSAGCVDFGQAEALLNAESRSTPNLGSVGRIPDADWPAARKIVERDAAAEGFDRTQVIKDQPGDHDIFIHGRYGSVLQFTAAANSALGITSGCHRLAGKPIDPDHPEST